MEFSKRKLELLTQSRNEAEMQATFASGMQKKRIGGEPSRADQRAGAGAHFALHQYELTSAQVQAQSQAQTQAQTQAHSRQPRHQRQQSSGQDRPRRHPGAGSTSGVGGTKAVKPSPYGAYERSTSRRR